MCVEDKLHIDQLQTERRTLLRRIDALERQPLAHLEELLKQAEDLQLVRHNEVRAALEVLPARYRLTLTLFRWRVATVVLEPTEEGAYEGPSRDPRG